MATWSIAVLTASGASRNTSARCGVAQSTTGVVTTPVSIAGISVRQSPTVRSNQFFDCGPAGVGDTTTDAGAVADVDDVTGASPEFTAAQDDTSAKTATIAQSLLLRCIFEELRSDLLGVVMIVH